MLVSVVLNLFFLPEYGRLGLFGPTDRLRGAWTRIPLLWVGLADRW